MFALAFALALSTPAQSTLEKAMCAHAPRGYVVQCHASELVMQSDERAGRPASGAAGSVTCEYVRGGK
jgi:hypothetical protein